VGVTAHAGNTSSESASSNDNDLTDPDAYVPPPDTYFDAGRRAHDKVLDDEVRKTPKFIEEKPQVTDRDKPKAGPPTLDEWQDFFARVVFLTLAEWYVSWCFRGVDEGLVTDEDLRRCQLDKEERKAIALPLSELANKSTVARKHGRQLIAFFESAEAFILIGMWMSKVHRVARKYKPQKGKPNVRMGPDAPNPNGAGPVPGPGGIVYPDVQVFNPGVG
jgi:hypothetical protein